MIAFVKEKCSAWCVQVEIKSNGDYTVKYPAQKK